VCGWQLGEAAENGPLADMLILTSSLPGTWLGDEQGVVGGHPTRKRVREGACTLKVALRRPDGPTDKAVLMVDLSLPDKTADPCPIAQKLTETALGRISGA
jgi:hypothetical protein